MATLEYADTAIRKIDIALGEERLQAAIDTVLASAARGPGASTHAHNKAVCLNTDLGVFDCTTGYGNGHTYSDNGGNASNADGLFDNDLFGFEIWRASNWARALLDHDAQVKHATSNLRRFPDLYGNSIWGMKICHLCDEAHDLDDATKCEKSRACYECGSMVFADDECSCDAPIYDDEEDG